MLNHITPMNKNILCPLFDGSSIEMAHMWINANFHWYVDLAYSMNFDLFPFSNDVSVRCRAEALPRFQVEVTHIF